MPRIAALELNQINRQLDTLDVVKAQVDATQSQLDNIGQSVNIADPIHAPSTTNNLSFTWTGSTSTLSWQQGFIKDKNWSTQTLASPPIKSSAKGQRHTYNVAPGSASLTPSTYYWIGWDHVHEKLIATPDASILHGNYNVHILCKIYTGTTGQSGTAGGGGSTGGVDLSGLTYKNF